jgi:Mg2+ and Co2+ transporter CorA
MKLKDILLEVEADQKVNAVVDDLKDDFASALNGIEDALEDAEDQKQEGVLTTASLLLALPAILGIIARLGKGATVAFQKIAGKKPTDQSSTEKYFQQLGRVADELHHLYVKPLEALTRKFIKDPEKSKKVANALFHVIVAVMMIASGATAVKAIQSKELSLATLESALTAVKGGEVKQYITKLIGA